MSTKASTLVAQAKQWATNYGPFTTGEEGAVLSAPLRFRAEWGNNDADALAAVFIENGNLLIGDDQLKGREEIRSYLAEKFAGPLKGSWISEEPIEIRSLSPEVAIAITQGGVVYEGDTGLRREHEVRAMWVVVKKDGEWRLASQQTSPVKG
jgi:uncharacterized protein (TIGR02246 family)